jgi:hypothetical protein
LDLAFSHGGLVGLELACDANSVAKRSTAMVGGGAFREWGNLPFYLPMYSWKAHLALQV